MMTNPYTNYIQTHIMRDQPAVNIVDYDRARKEPEDATRADTALLDVNA